MSQPRALGLHIYAGGFSLGVRKHFEVLGHLESSTFGVETVRQNMPEIPVFTPREKWPLAALKGAGVDFLYANPPCAVWSNANVRAANGGWRVDPRLDDTKEFFDKVKEFQPTIAAVESVPASLVRGEEFYSEQIASMGRKYSCTKIRTNARLHGIPQARPRVFYVLHKIGLDIVRPNAKPKLVRDLIGELPDAVWDNTIEPKWLPYAKATPQGRRVRDTWNKNPGKWKSGPTFFYARLHMDRCAPVPIRYPGWIHPTQHRYMDPQEVAYLSGYPRDYKFVARSPENHLHQVNRAVLPPVGEWLAYVAARSIRRNKPLASHSVTLIDMEAKE